MDAHLSPPKNWATIVQKCLEAGMAWPDMPLPTDDPKWVDVLVRLRDNRRAQAKLLATVAPAIVARAVAHHLEHPKGSLPSAWLEALAPHQADPLVHVALIAGFKGALRRTAQDSIPPSRSAWPAVLAEISGPSGWANRLVEAAMRNELFGLRTELEPYLDPSAETVSQNMLREAVRVGVPSLSPSFAGESSWPWFVRHCPPLARAGALLHTLAEENAWGVELLEHKETLPVPLADVVAGFAIERRRDQFLTQLNDALTRSWVPAPLLERVYQASRATPFFLPVFADRDRAEARQATLQDRSPSPSRPRPRA